MINVTFAVLFSASIIALISDFLSEKKRKILYFFLVIVLIFIAGFRYSETIH